MFLSVNKCIAIYALTLSCFLSSCNVETVTSDELPEPSTTVYTIRKGSHYTTSNSYKRFASTKLKFEVTFDNSAVYETQAAENQGDINKLYGVSDCGSEHHTNSARFGWRWFNNQLEVHAYTYVDKVRKSTYIGSVELGKAYVYELELKDGLYVFTLDGKQVTMPRKCSGAGEGYQLYPYFGGDEVAPHDINIKLKELL